MTDSESPTDPQKPAAASAENGAASPRSVSRHAVGIERLSQTFESSAKRLELIVYPSLFAFIILAAYGFYLVFSLAKDVHYLAISVDTNMTLIAGNMQSITSEMQQMTSTMHVLSEDVHSISGNVNTLQPMLASIQSMQYSIQQMTMATSAIRGDMAGMNESIGRPMHFMNGFMPW